MSPHAMPHPKSAPLRPLAAAAWPKGATSAASVRAASMRGRVWELGRALREGCHNNQCGEGWLGPRLKDRKECLRTFAHVCAVRPTGEPRLPPPCSALQPPRPLHQTGSTSRAQCGGTGAGHGSGWRGCAWQRACQSCQRGAPWPPCHAGHAVGKQARRARQRRTSVHAKRMRRTPPRRTRAPTCNRGSPWNQQRSARRPRGSPAGLRRVTEGRADVRCRRGCSGLAATAGLSGCQRRVLPPSLFQRALFCPNPAIQQPRQTVARRRVVVAFVVRSRGSPGFARGGGAARLWRA
eukprot:188054-Chlamydomonas_euryale.AAC.2